MPTRRKISLIVMLLLLLVGMLLITIPASACWEGCTPGFWKQEQHFQYWPTVLCTEEGWTTLEPLAACSSITNLEKPPQSHLVQEIFTIPGCLTEDGILDLNGDGNPDTLLDALDYKGGDDVEGKAQILLRAAAGSILNGMTMEHRSPGWTIKNANNALRYACLGIMGVLEYWADRLDTKNDQGCPISP